MCTFRTVHIIVSLFKCNNYIKCMQSLGSNVYGIFERICILAVYIMAVNVHIYIGILIRY